jgi:predicted DNA-binding WGR domain protein
MRRELVYASEKFWTLELDGKTHKIHFGKVGSAGQHKIKRYPNEATAKRDFDVVVAKKIKEGYRDASDKAPKSAKSAAPAAKTEKKAAAPPAPEPVAAASSVDESTTKSIALDEDDWRWATWRKAKAPRSVPDARPFDRDACLEALSKAKTRRYGWEWDLSKANLSLAISKDEARFWFEVLVTIDREKTPQKRADELKKKKLGTLGVDGALKALKKARNIDEQMVLVLTAMFGATAVTDMLITDKPSSDGWIAGGSFFQGWHQHVLPLLSEDEREALKKRVRAKVTPANFPTDYYEEPSGEFLVAASLGLHDELLKVVEALPDDHYAVSGGEDWHDAYHVPQLMCFGLGSAELVSKHARRLGLRMRFPEYMRAWIAHTEYDGLDWAAKTICETKNKDEAAKLAEVLALVHAPENAGPMLEVASKSKAPKIGAEWLDQNVGCAAAGLAQVAAGRGAVASAAQEKLRGLKRAGYTHLIPADAAVLKEAPEKVLPKMTAPPKWMADALAKAKSLKVPPWVEAAQLPPIEADGKTLDGEHVTALLAALAKSADEMQPLVAAIRENATIESRDAFAWKLFEAWLTEGAPSKEKWALGAVGWLGGDDSALKLAPMVRAWPGESQHARAVIGLDVLKHIGTDTALMQLSGIAAKVKFQALKARAGEAMEAIAKSRKMTRDELEDRIVPDGGFDESGKRWLDFGTRKFQVVLGSEGAPMVRDESGAKKSDLPKPGKTDDSKLAEKAHADWKLLKKTLREVTKIQVARLEQAMVKGRTWKAKDFETLVVKHPLMSHFARGLVFGSKKDTFRVAEDGSYADEKDAKYTLPKDALVRIMHPLDMSDAQKTAWGQVFADYELLPPFQQLGRQVFTIEDKEKKSSDLAARFKGQEWGVSAFIGKLSRRGWVHGQPQDAGFVNDHSKPFFSAGITAIVEHTGYPIGSRDWADPQKIEKLFFVKGTDPDTGWGASKKALKLADVDKKALSEVLLDLS